MPPKKWCVHYYENLKLLDGEIPIPNVFGFFNISVSYDCKKFLVVTRPDDYCNSIIPRKIYPEAVKMGYRLKQ